MAKLTPIRAIRLKCLDCTCSQKNEVRYCEIDTCPLWPYRMGRRPKTQRELAAVSKLELA